MKALNYLLLLGLMVIIGGCAGGTGGLKVLDEPVGSSVIVIGNVVIENINQEFEFDNWEHGAELVIIGRTADGTTNTYKVKTDAHGYYALPNVPSGQYAVKSITLLVFGAKPIVLVNDLTSSLSKFNRLRHPEEPIELTAEWLPPRQPGKIVNMDITWLGLRESLISDMSSRYIGEIMRSVLKNGDDLSGKRFWESGYPYTREDPLTHFSNLFPESSWWK